MNIVDFLFSHNKGNKWVDFTSRNGIKLELYIRVGPYYLDQLYDRVIQLASLSIVGFIEDLPGKYIPAEGILHNTGVMRELDTLVYHLGKHLSYDAIVYESVLNVKLPPVLERWGYIPQRMLSNNWYKLRT